MQFVPVHYDEKGSDRLTYLNPTAIVQLLPLERGSKECTLVRDCLGHEFWMPHNVWESRNIIESCF